MFSNSVPLISPNSQIVLSLLNVSTVFFLLNAYLLYLDANSQHVHRMIAFDEVQRDLDRQLEFINLNLIREPNESTYSFLKRIKSNSMPELTDTFVERLGFLHEWARYRTTPVSRQSAVQTTLTSSLYLQPFGERQLEELRELLKELVRL